MDFVMSEDPIIDKNEYANLNDLLDRVARNYGYTDRISAWHANCFGKDIQAVMPTILKANIAKKEKRFIV
jgi:hypothetical protein